MATGKPRQLERLEELKDPQKRRKTTTQKALKESDTMTRMLEKASPTLAKPLQPKNAAEMGKLKAKLAHASFRGEAAGTILLGFKFVGLLVGLVFGGGTVRHASPPSINTRWSIPVAVLACLLFYLPDLVVGLLSQAPEQAIFLALPDALDLMVVCVEAGLGLDQAMRKVAEEMRKTYRILAEEFTMSNFQLQMGRPRVEVSTNWARGPACPICGPWRRSHSDRPLRLERGPGAADAERLDGHRRCQPAEEKAAKTAVQLIFPLVLFIFPGIFVILVGPAAITMVREMFPLMGG